MVHDKYVQQILEIFHEIREYVLLQKEFYSLTFIEKATVFISTFVIGFILIILGMIALFYFSFMAANLIEPYVGGLWQSFGIITVFMILLMILFFKFRRLIIIRPIAKFLYYLLNDVKKQ